MDGSDVRRRGVTFVTLIAFVTWGSLWTLWSLGTGLTLHTGDTLYALGTLWTRGTLWPRITFGTGVSPASTEREGNANYQNGENLHDGPCAVCTLRHRRAVSISAFRQS